MNTTLFELSTNPKFAPQIRMHANDAVFFPAKSILKLIDRVENVDLRKGRKLILEKKMHEFQRTGKMELDTRFIRETDIQLGPDEDGSGEHTAMMTGVEVGMLVLAVIGAAATLFGVGVMVGDMAEDALNDDGDSSGVTVEVTDDGGVIVSRPDK